MQEQQPALVASSWTSSGANQLPSTVPPQGPADHSNQQSHTWIHNHKTHNQERNPGSNCSTSNQGHRVAHTPRIPELEPATAWAAGPGPGPVPLLACWASCFVYVTVFSLEQRSKTVREWKTHESVMQGSNIYSYLIPMLEAVIGEIFGHIRLRSY